jgi:hypothetical protein
MNQEIKNKWTTALRSGEYTQGTGNLRSAGDKFCCLGVLCDLAVKAEIIPVPVNIGQSYRYGAEGDMGHWFLPESVREWAGLDSTDPDWLRDDGTFSLSRMNDNGKTFDEIADVIEEKF